jgi:hypothetical protein
MYVAVGGLSAPARASSEISPSLLPPPSVPSLPSQTAAGKGERTLLTNLRKSGAATSVLFEALQEKCKVRWEGKEVRGGREGGIR